MPNSTTGVLDALARLHHLAVNQDEEMVTMMREAATSGASAEQIAMVVGDPVDHVRTVVGQSHQSALSAAAALWP